MKTRYLILPFLQVFILSCLLTEAQTEVRLPADFSEKAYSHVQDLAGFGLRNAGTKSERLTVNYLLDFYKGLKLEAVADTFCFDYFSAGSVLVFCNGKTIPYSGIYIDPYKGSWDLSAITYCITSGWKGSKIPADSIRGRIVFTDKQFELYRLIRCKPLAIVVVNDEELSQPFCKQARIKITGQVQKKRSYNVSCSLNPGKKKEILLGAHWDSFCGPGADDNASGVSVVMELSRFFTAYPGSLPYTVKVIFFGAEELGLLGSKAYTDKHIRDTSSTVFYFNLDSVGDTGAVILDVITGRRGRCLEPVTDTLRACRDFKNSWTLLDPLSTEIAYESELPLWLNTALEQSLKFSHHEYRRVRYCGSDHNSFANKGFITLHMGMDGNNVEHCPADNIKQVSKASLELSGKIAAGLIINAMMQQ